MPDQVTEASKRVCCVLKQSGYLEVGRNRKYIVMGKSHAKGCPNFQTSTILVTNEAVIAPDIISIISHKSGILRDQLT